MGVLAHIGRCLGLRRDADYVARPSARFVSPELVEWLLAHPDLPTPEPRPAGVEFVVALLDDIDLGRVPGLLIEVATVAHKHGAIVEHLTGPLVFLTFGTLPVPPKSDPFVDRTKCVRQLRERLGDQIRIVHGTGNGLVGEFGSPSRSQYGSALQGFGEAVRHLVSLPKGGVSEWAGGAVYAPSVAP